MIGTSCLGADDEEIAEEEFVGNLDVLVHKAVTR